MAFYVPDHDALFVHVPKCGGHFVEAVFDHFKIKRVPPKTIRPVGRRHGKRADYEPAKFAFCTTRDLDSWLWSYWFFMFNCDPTIFTEGLEHYHRPLGLPFERTEFHQWAADRRDQCAAYLAEMQSGCDVLIDATTRESMADGLESLLQSWGLSITREQILEVPKANVTKTCLELGGGNRNRGGEWVNVDCCPSADFRFDLNQYPLPFPDASIDAVYSSHCLEHLENPLRLLREIARICRIGAAVEIRVPHYAAEMAMVTGHLGVLSEQALINMDVHFVAESWDGPRRLKLNRTDYGAAAGLEKAKQELPFLNGLDDRVIMRWIQGTCHELCFHFTVIQNETFES